MSEKPIPKQCDIMDAHKRHRYLKMQSNSFSGWVTIQYECTGRK